MLQKGQQCDGETGCKGTWRVPIRCWNLPVHDRTTLRHCLQHEGNHERGSWTDHSLKNKVEANRALPQKTPAMCVEFPWVRKLADVIHVTVDADWAGNPKTRCSTSGGVLAIGPCFTVRHWSVTQATVSLSSAESGAKAITKDCIEVLYVKHLLDQQTARTFNQNRSLDGQQQRQSHHTTSWTRAQSETLGGADDVGSTVEQARSHLDEQAGCDGKRGRHDDKTCATRSSG